MAETVIETIFRFLGLEDGLRDVREFGKSASKALDELAKTGDVVSKGIGNAAEAISKGPGADKIKGAIKEVVGPNVIGSGILSGVTSMFGLLGKAAEAAFYPVKKLWEGVKSIGGLAIDGLKLGVDGIRKIGEIGLEGGKFFVDKFQKAVLAGGAIATALTTHVVTAANRISDLGGQASYVGISPEKFSYLKGIVGDADKASKGLRTLRESAAAAVADPMSEQGQLFGSLQQFGVQLTDETGQLRDAFDLLMQIRGVFQTGIFTPTQEGILAGQFFGKESGGAFLDVLKKTSEEMAQAYIDTEKSGNMISASQVSLAKTVKQAWSGIWDSIEGVGNKLFAQIGMPMSQLMTAVSGKIVEAGDDIVEVLSDVAWYVIGLGADLTALASRSDADGYRFIHPWMTHLAALRDGIKQFWDILRGDAGARRANPQLAGVVDLVRNDLIPRLMELGFAFASFFGRIVLPITVIVSSALQALLPSFDAVGNRVSGVGDKVVGLFDQLSLLVSQGPGAVSADWPFVRKLGESFDWLRTKASDTVEYIKGVWKTAKDWRTVDRISDKEGLAGLQAHQQAGDLPELDPRFRWVTKALTTAETLYKSISSVIIGSYETISNAIGPYVDNIGTALESAGKWLLGFTDALATFVNTGNVDGQFAWIQKAASGMQNLLQFTTQAFGYMTGLARSFQQFTEGVNVTDERFTGLMHFLDVLIRAFGTMNEIVKDIGSHFGLSGMQSQVALLALGFTGLGRKMMEVFGRVGKLILIEVVAPLLKAVGLEALLALPRKAMIPLIGVALGALAIDGMRHTYNEATDPEGDTSRVPGKVLDDVLSIPKFIMEKLIPQKYQDMFNGVPRPEAGDFAAETQGSRDAFEFATGRQRPEMNPDAGDDLVPFTQRPNVDTPTPTSTMVINVDGRRRAAVPMPQPSAEQISSVLQEILNNEDMQSLRGIPIG